MDKACGEKLNSILTGDRYQKYQRRLVENTLDIEEELRKESVVENTPTVVAVSHKVPEIKPKAYSNKGRRMPWDRRKRKSSLKAGGRS